MWWRNQKIRTKLFFAFGIIMLIFVISVLVMRHFVGNVGNTNSILANDVSAVMDTSINFNKQVNDVFMSMRELKYSETEESIANYKSQVENLNKSKENFVTLHNQHPELEGPIYALNYVLPLVKQYTENAEYAIVLINRKQNMMKEFVIVGEKLSANVASVHTNIYRRMTTSALNNQTNTYYLLSNAIGLSVNLMQSMSSIRHDVWHAIYSVQSGKGVEGIKTITEKAQKMQKLAVNLKTYVTTTPEEEKNFEKLLSDLNNYESMLNEFIDTCIELDQLHNSRAPVLASLSDGINNISSEANNKLKNDSRKSVEELDMTIYVLWLSTILSVTLSIIIAIAISRSISKPLNKIVNYARQIGGGNLTIKKEDFDYEGNDEMGNMITELANMIKTQNTAVKHIVKIAKELSNSAGSLSTVTEDTNASMEEIKASIAQVRTFSESNSIALEESNAGVEEMNAGADLVAQSATDSATFIAQTTEASNNAIETVRGVINGMRGVAKNSKESEEKIQQLVSSIENVSSFVSVITGIAAQTNLLALNAAIEAARAGEVGRGFAVVAEEVRKLAEESAHAAKNVSEIIQELQSGAQKTIKSTIEAGNLLSSTLNHAEEALDGLTGALSQINNANDSIQNIAATAEEQAAASREVARAIDSITLSTVSMVGTVENIHRATDETAQTAESVAKQAESMLSYVKTLDSLLSMFILDSSAPESAKMLEPVQKYLMK